MHKNLHQSQHTEGVELPHLSIIYEKYLVGEEFLCKKSKSTT